VKEALENGVLAGYPLVDVKVELVDGSFHDVDSSEMAFKIAGSMALKEAVRQADPALLEPIMDVEVVTPADYMGDVIGDLSSRRGKIGGMTQRADAQGNTQVWGLLGVQKEAAFASERVIVVAEELVDERVVRSDPNRTLIPAAVVSAVVVEPWGAHPSYAQGYYDRDNDFYVGWEAISKDRTRLAHYLDEFVYGVQDRAEYMQKQPRLAERLKAGEQFSAGVNYGF